MGKSQRRIAVYVCSFLVFLGFISTSDIGLGTKHAQADSNSQLIASTILGPPVAKGNYIFWSDTRNPDYPGSSAHSIYGYNLTLGKEFLVTDEQVDKYALATNGTLLVWAEDAPGDLGSIWAYDTTSQREYPLIQAQSPEEFPSIAVDAQTLYYQDSIQEYSTGTIIVPSRATNGIHTRDLVTGVDTLISATGRDPVAADGVLLYSEDLEHSSDNNSVSGQPTPTPLPSDSQLTTDSEGIPEHISVSEWRLHMQKPGVIADTVIADQFSSLSGYHVSGDSVTYSFNPEDGDGQAFLYTISSNTTQAITSIAASNPLVNGSIVAWTTEPSGAVNTSNTWAVQSTNVTWSGTNQATFSSPTTNIAPTSAHVELGSILSGGELLFTVASDPSIATEQLYLSNIAQSNLSFSSSAISSPNGDTCGEPMSCGHVYRQLPVGRSLKDAGGTWPVNGVQYLAPELGINSQDFMDSNYSTQLTSMNFWLHMIGRVNDPQYPNMPPYLLASSVRIYVPLPNSDGTSPMQYSTIYYFATRADKLNLRVGLTFWVNYSTHAPGALTAAQKTWFIGLINYLKHAPDGRDWTTAIAYANAENEINNHCTNRADGDCYDSYMIVNPNSPSHGQYVDNTQYVRDANQYVADFATVFHQNSSILVTVGLSTEMTQKFTVNGQLVEQGDGQPAANDFFRYPVGVPPLAPPPRLVDSVDFLSPHNYGGNADGIWNDTILRQNRTGPIQPVVLEEYGFPTDPKPSVYYRQEGCANGGDPYDRNQCPTWFNADGTKVLSASYFVETNARSLRGMTGTGYAGGVAFMVADMGLSPSGGNNKNCSSGNPNLNAGDLFTGLFAAGASSQYDCSPSGTTTIAPGAPKSTAFRIRTHHYYHP